MLSPLLTILISVTWSAQLLYPNKVAISRRSSSARSRRGAFRSRRASKLSCALRRVSALCAYLSYECFVRTSIEKETLILTYQWEYIRGFMCHIVQLLTIHSAF